jgi:hypothetical protein
MEFPAVILSVTIFSTEATCEMSFVFHPCVVSVGTAIRVVTAPGPGAEFVFVLFPFLILATLSYQCLMMKSFFE